MVQPVLDKKCVACHKEDPNVPQLNGQKTGEWGWSLAYHDLAPFAWAKHGGNGAIKKNKTSYSVAGDVGAQASKLMKILDQDHHGVKLTKEELHRISLWLDCNSVFYGAYHDTEKQARGETVKPALE